MPFKHYGSLCCLILSSTILVAQTDSLPNLKGRFIVGGIDGGNNFRIEAREISSTGEIKFENSENHSLKTTLGYGFYYGANKALTIELSSSVMYFDFSTFKSWNNNYGGAISKMKLKNIYQNKLFVLVNQRLSYNYTITRDYNKPGSQSIIYVPNRNLHGIFYGVTVGAFYKPNNNLAYRLTIPIVGVGASISKSYGSTLNDLIKTTDYYYNTSFYYSISNIQLSVLWSPSIIQSKKNKQ